MVVCFHEILGFRWSHRRVVLSTSDKRGRGGGRVAYVLDGGDGDGGSGLETRER